MLCNNIQGIFPLTMQADIQANSPIGRPMIAAIKDKHTRISHKALLHSTALA